MINDIYELCTSPLILYPALLLAGATIYEWTVFASLRMDRPGSRWQLYLLKQSASLAENAFLSPGLSRNIFNPEQSIEALNKRLENFSLPLVPDVFSPNENVNKLYAQYLSLIKTGDIDLAKRIFVKLKPIIKAEASQLQSPLSIVSKTQP